MSSDQSCEERIAAAVAAERERIAADADRCAELFQEPPRELELLGPGESTRTLRWFANYLRGLEKFPGEPR